MPKKKPKSVTKRRPVKRKSSTPAAKPRRKAKPTRSSVISVSSVAQPSEAAAQKRRVALGLFLGGRPLSTHQVGLVCDYIRPLFARVPQKLVEELLGSSRKVLLEWTGQGAPRSADGTWPLGPLMQWLKAKWVKTSRRGGIPDADGQVPLEIDWDERLKKAKAISAERANAEAEARLVARDLVHGLFGELAITAALVLKRLPDLARDVAGASQAKARSILAAFRDRARVELSEKAARCAGALGPDEEGKKQEAS